MSAPYPHRDAGPLVIGRVYRVPCVRAPWYGRTAWWPVIGPLHDDRAIIDFAPRHWHVDGRFLSAAQECWLDSADGGSARAIAAAPLVAWPAAPLALQARRCRRLATGFAAWTPAAEPDWFGQLRAAYAAARLGGKPGGWVCPHKGAPLASCPIAADGTITCPLHGLVWHAASGRPAWGAAQ